MAKVSTEAYDLSLFDAKTPRLRAVKSPEKAAELQQKRERAQQARSLAGKLVIAAILVAAVAMMIVSRVQLTELNDQISSQQDQLAILQSETSRLTNELASKTSAQNVDEYATENGMTKAESYQIEYITVDGGDQVAVADTAPQGIFESVGAAIAGWFGN